MISCVEVMRVNLYVSFSEPFRFLFYDENEIVEPEQLDFGSTLQIWFAILYLTRSYMNFCLTWTYYWEKFPKINNLVFLIATWNLNLINHHCHKATSDFLDLLYSRMFFPLITRPTRITANKVSSQAAQAHYLWVRASEVIWSEYTRIISVLSDAK